MPKPIELKDLAIRNHKLPEAGNIQVPDGKVPGFGIRISSMGTKTFNLRVRFKGQQLRIIIGHYPDISLGDARKLAEDARVAARKGIHPAAVLKSPGTEAVNGREITPAAPVKTLSSSPIFCDAVAHYVRSYLDTETKPSTAKEKTRNLKATFFPHFRDKLIDRITFEEILAVLEHIRDVKKKPSASLHAYKDLNHFFN